MSAERVVFIGRNLRRGREMLNEYFHTLLDTGNLGMVSRRVQDAVVRSNGRWARVAPKRPDALRGQRPTHVVFGKRAMSVPMLDAVAPTGAVPHYV